MMILRGVLASQILLAIPVVYSFATESTICPGPNDKDTPSPVDMIEIPARYQKSAFDGPTDPIDEITESDEPSDGEEQEEEEEENWTERERYEKVTIFSTEDCVDEDPECAEWADEGECLSNSGFMMNHCRKSCLACDTEIYLDLGVPQALRMFYANEIWERVLDASHYLNQVWEDEFLSMAYDSCANKYPLCAYWAVQGECDEGRPHDEWMHYNCAPMCETCELTSVYTRCPLDPDVENVWKQGDVHSYFEHVTTAEEFQSYEPHVWSRPGYAEGDTEETANYALGAWLVTMENYFTEDEALRMTELGRLQGYERSGEFGDEQEDGSVEGDAVSDRRTSTNAFCEDECLEDPLAKDLKERMAHLAGMPADNAEPFQLLRYEPGQFYEVHHDYAAHERYRQQGPRILTIFVYLSNVEEGGGTNFPEMENITVTPKLGRVVLWPSVLDEAPEDKDFRTRHQALPVTKGMKYAANLWFHQRNYMEPWWNECTL